MSNFIRVFLFLNYLLFLKLSLFFHLIHFPINQAANLSGIHTLPLKMHYQYSPLGNPESSWDVRSNGNLSFFPSVLQPFKNKNAHRGPVLPRNQAFWNGPHPMIYNGEKGYCPNPRQHNQESTPGTYSDKLSPFCNSRPYSRSSDYLVHPTHSTGSSNSFSNSYEPTL